MTSNCDDSDTWSFKSALSNIAESSSSVELPVNNEPIDVSIYSNNLYNNIQNNTHCQTQIHQKSSISSPILNNIHEKENLHFTQTFQSNVKRPNKLPLQGILRNNNKNASLSNLDTINFKKSTTSLNTNVKFNKTPTFTHVQSEYGDTRTKFKLFKSAKSDTDSISHSKISSSSSTIMAIKNKFSASLKRLGLKSRKKYSSQLLQQDYQSINTNNQYLTTTSSKEFNEKMKIKDWIAVNEFNHISEPTESEAGQPIWIAKFSSCGRLFAVAGQGGNIYIWVLYQYLEYFKSLLGKFEDNFSINNFDKNSISNNKSNQNRDKNPFGHLPLTVLKGQQSDIYDFSWSINSTHFIASATRSGLVLVWQLKKSEPLLKFDHKEPVTGIQFMQDVRRIVTITKTGCLRICDIVQKRMQKLIKVTLHDKNFSATTMSLFHDYSRIVVGCSGGKLKIYEIKSDINNSNSNKIVTFRTEVNMNKSKKRVIKIRKLMVYKTLNNRGNCKSSEYFLVTTGDFKIMILNTKDFTTIATFKSFHPFPRQPINKQISFSNTLLQEIPNFGATISQDYKLITLSIPESGQIYLFPFSFNEYSNNSSIQRNQSKLLNKFSLQGYNSNNWVRIESFNSNSSNLQNSSRNRTGSMVVRYNVNELTPITSICFPPRTDFFANYFKQNNVGGIGQSYNYVIITTHQDGKIRILVNVSDKAH